MCDFMNRSLSDVTLTGATLRVRPMLAADYTGLLEAASDPEIWRLHSEPDRYKPDVFKRFFEKALELPGCFVIEDIVTGKVLGSSRYYDYDSVLSTVMIGYTFLRVSSWGGRVNQELKVLMIEHAFQFVEKILFHTSENNLRSRRAILKLGAKEREEILDVPGIGKRVEFSLTKEQWQTRGKR